MFEYITHYYSSVPFRRLSALSRSEAMKVMNELCDDSPIFERFKEPVQYWENRLEAENWLRNGFIEKGGVPKEKYPFYAVLGTADWIENYALSEGLDLNVLRIPLSLFSEKDVSFTVPDSMVSFWIGRDKPKEYYNVKFHGQVFTISEIKANLTADVMSNLESMIPSGIPYVEAQIWNHEVAMNFYNRCEQEKRKPNDGFLSLLSAPARRALEHNGIISLQILSQYSEREIVKLHGMGPASLPKLRDALREKGLSFKS